METILHGENMLVKVDSLPEINGKVTKGKSIVIAHSETGHNHVVESTKDLELIVDGLEEYLVVTAPAKIKHQKSFDKHETLDITPGIYKIAHKQEYNPFEGVMQKVFD